jgi:SAM-dependent methyltransferase
MRALRPYSVLAAHYDDVYAIWRSFLGAARDEILRSKKASWERTIDIGCGSGWQSLELARRGAHVVAVDPVRPFLRRLRARAREERLEVEVREGALPDLPLRPGDQFDLAIATFDVLNHLEHKSDLLRAFRSVRSVLRNRGHFLFDLNTPETIELFPEHHRVVRLEGEILSAESGAYDEESGVGTVRRDWFLPVVGGRGVCRRLVEEYREIAWEEDEIVAALKETGFVIRLFADASGWMSFSPRGARWIVLAKAV